MVGVEAEVPTRITKITEVEVWDVAELSVAGRSKVQPYIAGCRSLWKIGFL